MTTSKQIEAEAGLAIDWEQAAAQAFVVNHDGSFQTRDDNTELAAENTKTLFTQIQGAEVRTPSHSVPIERITERVGKPVIHRAQVNLSSLEARELEAARVREEAEEAKRQAAAESFLRLPAGQRIVQLEEKVATLESKIDKILAAVEAKPTKTTRKTKANGTPKQQPDPTA